MVGCRFRMKRLLPSRWVEAEVLEIEPPHRMVWSWSHNDGNRPSIVTFELVPEKEGTRLRLRHVGEFGAADAGILGDGGRDGSSPSPRRSAGASYGCSFWADNFNGIIVHLNQRDVTMVAASRAHYSRIAAYKTRMGWTFDWVSSGGTDFNVDDGVSFTTREVAEKKADYNYTIQDPMHTEREGLSVFIKDDEGKIFHTYSAYARGIDMVNATYQYLDLVPKGRDEGDRGPYWVRRHDEYED